MSDKFSLEPVQQTPAEADTPTSPAPDSQVPESIDVVSPAGELGTIPGHQLKDALDSGYRIPTAEDTTKFENEKKYSGALEQAKTAVEGVGQGVAGPLFTGAETALLGNEEEQRGRAEVNPITHGAAQVAGFVAPAIFSAGSSAAARAGIGGAEEAASFAAKAAEFSQAGLLDKAGSAVVKGLNLGGNEASLLGKIGAKSVSEATQMALLQGGDEVTKMIQNDPNQTAETAMADIGLAGVLGGTVGGVFGAVSPLWKATVGDKAAQLIEDFKGRVKFNAENPEPVKAVADELGAHYNDTRALADEVYGPSGLKAQDVEKAMPEMHEGIPEQAQGFANQLEDSIAKMEQKPNSYPERLVSKARDDFDAYRQAVQDPGATPADIFNATQDLKQTMQGYAKFDKFVKPVDEAYDFVSEAKGLAHSLREGLEDSDVWGKAADRQKAINAAFTDYLPTLKDFEKKFTVEVGGEKQIDPGKVQTYMNQLGKPSAEIKQTMLDNFLKESEKYRGVISDTHANLGIDSPVTPSSLSVTKSTFGKITPGQALADYFNKSGIYHLAGESLGTTIGAGLGHALGSGAAGAVIGERALAPFFKSVLPALMKPFETVAANSSGVKAAIDYGLAAARGETVLNKAAKGLFREGADNVINIKPDESARNKLDTALKSAQNDPSSLTKIATNVGHFMPDHAVALTQTASNAVQYLNSLKPDTTPKAPLDPKMPPSPAQTAAYNRALDLANQPLLAMKSIAKGTLTPQDVTTIKTIYPSLYASLSQKIANEMAVHVSKENTVPYSRALQVSLFLGQPLDSTMTQPGILNAQPKPSQQPQPPGQPGKPPAASSVKGLGKMAEIARTPSQARAEARSVDKG